MHTRPVGVVVNIWDLHPTVPGSNPCLSFYSIMIYLLLLFSNNHDLHYLFLISTIIVSSISWIIIMSLILVPVLLYLIMLIQRVQMFLFLYMGVMLRLTHGLTTLIYCQNKTGIFHVGSIFLSYIDTGIKIYRYRYWSWDI